MKNQVINTTNAVMSPFSAAIKSGNFIFTSGQIGIQDPATGEKIEGIEAQCKQCLNNIKEILEMAGSSLNDVVKVTVFIRNSEDFDVMNKVYQNYFPNYRPARSTVVTDLVRPNILVEMECISACPVRA